MSRHNDHPNKLGMVDWKWSTWETLRMCWCFRSTIKFCYGVWVEEWKGMILFASKKLEKANLRALF